jgi:hypothetical protein
MNRRYFLLLPAAPVAAMAKFKGASYRARRAGGGKRERGAGVDSMPIEFIVTAQEPFPVRALDPVLHVGAYEVRDYRYGNAGNTMLIFTCGEPESLGENAPVFLQYEDDSRTRTELPPFRRNAVE